MYKIILLSAVITLALTSDVLDYSGGDFEDRVKEHDTVLIEFFAPWCGHCKRLAPEYEKAATTLKTHDPSIPLAKVDCTSDNGKETCNKYGVSGYPTLKIFRNGEFSSEYSGPREADGIVKYMRAQVGPSSKELKVLAESTKFTEKDDVVVIGFFKDPESSLKQEFMKAAEKLRESVNFGHSFTSEILDKFGYSDHVVLFRPKKFHSKFEDKQAVFDGSASKSEIEAFIKSNYHGLVGHRTHDNFNDFQSPLVVAYYDVDYVKNTKGTNYWRNRIMKVADNFKDKLHFAVSSKEKFSAELEDYGLTPRADKPVVALRNEKQQKFPMKEEFSMESFEKFLQDFVDGKLEPHLKSEPLPESNDGPVKVAVAQNFQELVMDSDKDVLIEFYAPWCGHCKKLAPTFEELGKELQDEENIVIVKMDATANDVPSPFEVQGFPTLYWAPKGQKQSPQQYQGGRELDDFLKYIAKQSTNELKGYDRKGKKKTKKTEL